MKQKQIEVTKMKHLAESEEKIPYLLDEMISIPEAADFIGYSRQYFLNIRLNEGMPQFYKIGCKIYYKISDLKEWQIKRIEDCKIVPDMKKAWIDL